MQWMEILPESGELEVLTHYHYLYVRVRERERVRL